MAVLTPKSGIWDLYFTKFTSYHKWNEAWLLVIHMVYTSAKWLKTWKIKKYQENLKTS